MVRKRLLILALALVLMLSGCAFLQGAKGFFCNPTPQQQEEAQMAKNFLLLAGDILGYPFEAQVAWGVFDAIAKGLCVTVDQLGDALDTVDHADELLDGFEAIRWGMPKMHYPKAPPLHGRPLFRVWWILGRARSVPVLLATQPGGPRTVWKIVKHFLI